MDDKKKDEVVTPLVGSLEKPAANDQPQEINVDAPISTDAEDREVDLPDLGGKID